MKEIPLTNRDFPALVSDEDYEFLTKFSWFAKNSRFGEYACTSVRVKGRVFTFRMHRLVMRCFNDQTVDHKNGKHFDNQQDNLEIMSNEENATRGKPEECEVPF